MHQPEALFIAQGPFVIVHQRPREIAAQVGARRDGRPARVQMRVDIGQPRRVIAGPVNQHVGIGHAVLGDVDRQPGGQVAQAQQEIVQTLWVDLPPHLRLGQRPFDPVQGGPGAGGRGDVGAGVIVQAQPIQRRGDGGEIILPALGQVGFQPCQNLGRIGAAQHALDEKAVVDGVIPRRRLPRRVAVIGGVGPFHVEHATQVGHAQIAHHPDCRAMRQQDMVHRPRGGANVAHARRVVAQEMRQPRHAPRLVDGGGRPDAVTDAVAQDARVVTEPPGDIAVAPAALVGQRLGQFPVIQRQRGLDPARQHPVDQPVVEVETLGVGCARPLGQDARPGRRKAVDVDIQLRQQVQIAFPAQVMLAGARAMFRAHHVAGGRGETVPMCGARSAQGMPLDLIGRGRGPEQEAVGKIGAGVGHDVSEGAGPVEVPSTTCASSKCWRGVWSGSLIRSMSMAPVRRPASRTELRVAVKIGTSPPLPR